MSLLRKGLSETVNALWYSVTRPCHPEQQDLSQFVTKLKPFYEASQKMDGSAKRSLQPARCSYIAYIAWLRVSDIACLVNVIRGYITF
jgi:hypothetical protein